MTGWQPGGLKEMFKISWEWNECSLCESGFSLDNWKILACLGHCTWVGKKNTPMNSFLTGSESPLASRRLATWQSPEWTNAQAAFWSQTVPSKSTYGPLKLTSSINFPRSCEFREKRTEEKKKYKLFCRYERAKVQIHIFWIILSNNIHVSHPILLVFGEDSLVLVT